MKENNILKLADKNGNEKEYKILVAFQNNNKNYIIYTDNTSDSDDNLNVYASIYNPDDETRLDEIQTEEEWNLIETILESLKNR